jgi:hypothetical protein
MVLSEYCVLVMTRALTGGKPRRSHGCRKTPYHIGPSPSRHNPLRLVRRKQEYQLNYVLEGRVVTMDAASIVLQAGPVYIGGQNAIKAGLKASYPT